MEEIKTPAERRQLKGVVTSDKMNKTIVVQVDRTVVHPKYQKRYVVSKKYKVHDEENAHKVGETVTIEETRPLSKDKRFRVVK
jgi:small subunit ribosomal protein S17